MIDPPKQQHSSQSEAQGNNVNPLPPYLPTHAPMTVVLPQPWAQDNQTLHTHTNLHHRNHPNLLSLDCSSDLSQYSRNLGPGPRKNTFNLPKLQLPVRHQGSGVDHPQRSDARQISTSVHRYSEAAPPQLLQQYAHQSRSDPPYVPFATVGNLDTYPKPGNIATYPAVLRGLLERSHQINIPSSSSSDNSIVYNIIEDVHSNYMDDSSRVIATHRSLHNANLAAAEHCVEAACLSYEEPSFQLSEDGCLLVKFVTDGSMRGTVKVFVSESRLRM